MPVRSRIVLSTLASLALAALLLACGDDADPVCGGADTCSFGVGEHTLVATRDGDGWALRLEASEGGATRTVWATAAGQAMVQLHPGHVDIESNRGSFKFFEYLDRDCTASRITAIAPASDGALTVSGVLDDCDGRRYTLTFREVGARRVDFDLRLVDRQGQPLAGVGRTDLVYASDPDEGFFGFGAQYSVVNMKGKKLPIWCQEQGHGRGGEPITSVLDGFSRGSAGSWDSTYTCAPWYLTNRGHGVFLDNMEYLSFDLEAPEVVSIEAWADGLRGGIVHGPTPLDLLETYTEHVGRMQPLPAWTQKGAIVRTFNDGAQAAFDQLDELATSKTPVAGLWLEDWAGTRQTAFGTRMLWNWVPDQAHYPDFAKFIGELHARGVPVLAYFNPYLADASEVSPDIENLYAEAAAKGYLVLDPAGQVYRVEFGGYFAAIVDLSNPEARAWLKGIIKAQIANGIDGWMADFGEVLPADAKLHNGADPIAYHNQFLLEWATLNREAAEESGRGDDLVFFTRGGAARSPGVSKLFWLGDQLTTWDEYDGMKTVVPALLSSGLSGYALQHPDTGGWLSVDVGSVSFNRTPEMYRRWVEISAFTAMLRLHTSNKPETNTQYNSDPETFAHFTRFATVFALLADYRTKLMDEAAQHGWPLVRHLMLHYPDDPAVYDLTEEFMLGSELLVAPVVDEGATTVEVYFPAGEWVNLWTDEVRGDIAMGTRELVDAPVGQPAVFYRKGSPDGEALVQKLEAAGLR